jgi:antitoxin ParD1/3/4/toxin ParE1/3/4
VNRYVVTPEARADLFAIWEHIAQDSIDAADKVIGQIEKSFGRLADMPGMGHFREDLLYRRYRFWVVYSYVIAYVWQKTPIQIIAVVHGARDLEAFLPKRGASK